MVENDHDRGDLTRLGREVGRKAERKIRGRGRKTRTVWFGLGMFGLVGWAVAVPALIGVGVGIWLDGRYPQDRVSWTLTFMIIGIGVGCLNAWYWVKQETRDE